MKKTIFNYVLLQILIIMLSGCHHCSYKTPLDTPLEANCRKSEISLDYTMVYTTVVNVTTNHESKGRLERFCVRANKFLKKVNYDPGDSHNIIDSTYQELLEYCMNVNCDAFSDIGYCKEKKIICLEPLIIVITGRSIGDFPQTIFRNEYLNVYSDSDRNVDYIVTTGKRKQFNFEYGTDYVGNDAGTIIHYDSSPLYLFSFLELDRENVSSKKDLLLMGGYTLGTSFPDTGEVPIWFSPDMKISPKELKLDNEGIGHISVPWGELLFTKENGIWNVTCQSSK